MKEKLALLYSIEKYNKPNDYVCLCEQKRVENRYWQHEERKNPIFRTNNNVPNIFLDETDTFSYALYIEIAKN